VRPIVAPGGEGHAQRFSCGEKHVWKATAITTDGVMDLVACIATPGYTAVAAHIHRALAAPLI